MSSPPEHQPALRRRLGLFDATMLVMGGIVGSGIFVNPAEVAAKVPTPMLMVGVWLIGGAIAIAGAFVYAELAARRPEVGGQYAYLRDAWGPLPAFLYGWSLLLVIQSGGMAAVAITFARYFHELTGLAVPDGAVAAAILLLLTAINCWGVKAGSNVQSTLMVLKILAIVALVLCGLLIAGPHQGPSQTAAPAEPLGLLAALTPVMFAYGGWQTSSFVAGEMRDPRRDLARGLLFGVIGVVALYTAVALTCVVVLGPQGLAQSTAPASAVMRLALGDTGATLIALGIAISTLGFLSQSMLTAPRVYFAMAEDKLFFRKIGEVSETTRVPVFAILLQGAVAMAIALSGTYGQILSYEPLAAAARYLGADVRHFSREGPAFALDPEAVKAALTGRTTLIVLTNLHNPTGNLADTETLRSIGALGPRVLIDEVYLDAAPGQRSAALLGDAFVCTSSLTKVYGLSGLRCGWILANPDLAERLWRLNELFSVAQSHPAERLSLIALARLDEVAAGIPDLLSRNRALANAFFVGRSDLEVAPMTHNVTCFPRLKHGDVDALNARLRTTWDTSIVPGRFFGLADHFRLGVGGPTDIVEAGLERLGRALDERA